MRPSEEERNKVILNAEEREVGKKVLRIVQDSPGAMNVMAQLVSNRPVRIYEIVHWLHKNMLFGDALIQFFGGLDNSVLKTVAFVQGKIDGEKVVKLYAGRDFHE